MPTSTSESDKTLAERYARLDAFLQSLRGDIYPEPPTPVHTSVTRQMSAVLQETYPQAPGARVLDVGCGQGVALEVFREAGLDPVGITLGPDAEVCRQKGFEVLEMDFSILDLPDESFDMVWCRHAIEHSVFPFFTLAELHRVLKPGGALYVEVPAPDTASHHETNRNHYSVFGRSMWVQLLLRVGFPEVRMKDINFANALGPDTYWAYLAKKPV